MFPVVEKKEKKETKWKGPSSQKNCTERNHFQSRSEKDHFHKVSIGNFIANLVFRLKRVRVASRRPIILGYISVVDIIVSGCAMESSVPSVRALNIRNVH
jgi:hypothetical protein